MRAAALALISLLLLPGCAYATSQAHGRTHHSSRRRHKRGHVTVHRYNHVRTASHHKATKKKTW